jgi:hypothetical protein
VFSSDRFAEVGYSAPYGNATYKTDGGEQRTGNADLWYSFRRIGDSTWSAPRNLASIGDSINTSSNEYSPFIYCAHTSPHLLFSSDRRGTFDIYDARLIIDWNAQTITLVQTQPVLQDSAVVRATSNDLFPFVPYPHYATTHRDLYFSSDYFEQFQPDSARAAGYGGLDIYALRASLDCQPVQQEVDTFQPPQQRRRGSITYNLTVLDNATKQPVQAPYLSLEIGSRIKMDTASATITMVLDSASLDTLTEVSFRAAGGSTYLNQPCQGAEPVLTEYIAPTVSRTFVRERSRAVDYDSVVVVQPPSVRVERMVEKLDTLPAGTTLPADKSYRFAGVTSTQQLIIGSMHAVTEDSVPPAISETKRFQRTFYDTTWAYDTAYVQSRLMAAPSQLTRFAVHVVPVPDSDIVINDTVWLQPVMEVAPLCMEMFESSDSVRNIPYFQTAFWEVNTRNGYERHMARLRQGDLRSASWVELNWKNKYWASRSPGDISPRLQRRREEYREMAGLIDEGLDSMTTRSLRLLHSFMEYDGDKPEAKFVMSMLAYSDYRPITLGRFISDTAVTYMATSYDSVAKRIQPATAVHIRANASLVGKDNDTLSKLRAYYGYRAVYQRLRQDSLFAGLEQAGLVLLPDEIADPNTYYERLKKARVIVLAEGRYVDTSEMPKRSTYGSRVDDYYSLDWVRRVDIQVRRVRLRGDTWIDPECCR